MSLSTLMLLFIIIPLTDLIVLLYIAKPLGAINTVALVIVTGMIGATLARQQGFTALNDIRNDLHGGRMPTDSLFAGLLVLVGAVLLLTPGVMTDIVGLLLMVPTLRRALAGPLKRYVGKNMKVQTFHMPNFKPMHTSDEGTIKEAEGFRVIDDEVDPMTTEQPSPDMETQESRS